MINYNKVFEVAHSNVSEDIKNLIFDNILLEAGPDAVYESLNEAEEISPLVEYLDVISKEAPSIDVLEALVEDVFYSVDEAVTEEVNEEFKKVIAKRILLERAESINELFGWGKSAERKEAEAGLKTAQAAHSVNKQWDAEQRKRAERPIGLAQLRRADKAGQDLEASKKDLDAAQARLKDVKARERKEAVDKVKGTVSKVWNKIKTKGAELASKGKAAIKAGVAKGARAVASAATNVADRAEGKNINKNLNVSDNSTAHKEQDLKPSDTPKADSSKGEGVNVSKTMDFSSKSDENKKPTEEEKEENNGDGQQKLDLPSPEEMNQEVATHTDRVRKDFEEQKSKLQKKIADAQTKGDKRLITRYSNQLKKLEAEAQTVGESFEEFANLLTKTNISKESFSEILETVVNSKLKAIVKEDKLETFKEMAKEASSK